MAHFLFHVEKSLKSKGYIFLFLLILKPSFGFFLSFLFGSNFNLNHRLQHEMTCWFFNGSQYLRDYAQKILKLDTFSIGIKG